VTKVCGNGRNRDALLKGVHIYVSPEPCLSHYWPKGLAKAGYTPRTSTVSHQYHVRATLQGNPDNGIAISIVENRMVKTEPATWCSAPEPRRHLARNLFSHGPAGSVRVVSPGRRRRSAQLQKQATPHARAGNKGTQTIRIASNGFGLTIIGMTSVADPPSNRATPRSRRRAYKPQAATTAESNASGLRMSCLISTVSMFFTATKNQAPSETP